MTGGATRAGETIHATLALYDPKGTYSQHAGVVMTSIFENTESPVVVHVLHDNTLTEGAREKFLCTAAKYAQEVHLVDVTPYRDQLDARTVALAQDACSVGTLYRLLIPDLLSIDRAVYLDCDTLVNLDLRELWEVSLDGNCLAGALDHPGTGLRRLSAEALRVRLNGGDPASYVNAGVLLMDLDRIRERGSLFQASMDWLAHRGHTARLADQDILNSLFRGSIKLLDGRFNNRRLEGDPSHSILHMINESKPWLGLTGLPSERLYWRTYLRSAWGDHTTPDELIDLLSQTASHTPSLHRHTAQCWRQIGRRVRRDILCGEPVIAVGLLARELFHRLAAGLRGGPC